MTIGLKTLLLPPCRDSNTVYLPLPCNLPMPPLVKIAGGESSRTPVTLPCSFLKPLQVAHFGKTFRQKKEIRDLFEWLRAPQENTRPRQIYDHPRRRVPHPYQKAFSTTRTQRATPAATRVRQGTALRPSSSKIESPPRDQKYVRAGFLPTACDDHALRRKATLLSTNAGGEGLQGVMSERCRRHQRPLIQRQQRERVHKKKVHGCVRTPSAGQMKKSCT